MENAEEVFNVLEDFSKRKPKTIPQELNEYLAYVARTGDPVYQWALVKSLFKEKLLNVITDFYETTPGIDIPPYPNVDPFNYDVMKDSLIERLDSFTSAPFTVQRICELLAYPRKQYNRVDKFMRAIEKNILVVSTREPGIQRHVEQENGEPNEPIVNGSDNNSDYNVDVEMEDVSWKENSEQQNAEPQPSSSDSNVAVNSIQTCMPKQQDDHMDTQEKSNNQTETVVVPTQNTQANECPQVKEISPEESVVADSISIATQPQQSEEKVSGEKPQQAEVKDIEMKSDVPNVLIIPEIKVDDAEMTEHKHSEPNNSDVSLTEENLSEKEVSKTALSIETSQPANEDSCSSNITKEDTFETKVISEVSNSSEESFSSSDNTDGNSNSPKSEPEMQSDSQVESDDATDGKEVNENSKKQDEPSTVSLKQNDEVETIPQVTIQADNYSISDVHSEIKEVPQELESNPEIMQPAAIVEEKDENKLVEHSEPVQSSETVNESEDSVKESPAE